MPWEIKEGTPSPEFEKYRGELYAKLTEEEKAKKVWQGSAFQ